MKRTVFFVTTSILLLILCACSQSAAPAQIVEESQPFQVQENSNRDNDVDEIIMGKWIASYIFIDDEDCTGSIWSDAYISESALGVTYGRMGEKGEAVFAKWEYRFTKDNVVYYYIISDGKKWNMLYSMDPNSSICDKLVMVLSDDITLVFEKQSDLE